MSKSIKSFALKNNQKGIALAMSLIMCTVFILIATSVLYISVLNSKTTREQTQLVKDNIITDSAIKVALEKVKRYMLSSSLAKFQPNVNFGYNSDQMSKLVNLSPGDDIPAVKTKLTLLPDDSGTTPIEKVFSGETFVIDKNYYKFNMQTGAKDTEVRYRIIDGPWLLRSDNQSEAIKRLTIYSISDSVGAGRWRGIKADVEIVRSNLYNYGVFFKDDLEIQPGATMTFKGKVHTNKNMYLGGSLTFGTATNNKSEVTSAGHIYFGRKNTNDVSGTVKIYDKSGKATAFTANVDSVVSSKTNSFQSHDLEKTEKEFKDNDTPTGLETWKVAKSGDSASQWNTSTVNSKTWDWKSGALDTWQGMVQDSSHGVKTKTPPPVETIGPNGAYAKKAGLYINTDVKMPGTDPLTEIKTTTTTTGSGTTAVKTETITQKTIETIEVRNGKDGEVLYKKDIIHTNTIVKETVKSKTTVKSDVTNSNVNADTYENNLDISPQSASGSQPAISQDPFDTLKFSNNREKKQLRNTVVDISSLQQSSYWPASGLVYATRTDVSQTNPTGIMITNGSRLSKEINFVSNNPVYVRGDFNKHQKSDKTVINDTDTSLATASDMWKPASIISDATTMLSNSWDPTNVNYSQGTGSPTAASGTEYNFTMVTGNVATKRTTNTEDDYSGGLENFPRFLEDWSGKTAKFRGSLIQLWQSTYATASWKNGGYSAPNRDWGYDESFNKTDLPENFTEMFPSVAEGIIIQNWRYIDASDPVLKKSGQLSMIN